MGRCERVNFAHFSGFSKRFEIRYSVWNDYSMIPTASELGCITWLRSLDGQRDSYFDCRRRVRLILQKHKQYIASYFKHSSFFSHSFCDSPFLLLVLGLTCDNLPISSSPPLSHVRVLGGRPRPRRGARSPCGSDQARLPPWSILGPQSHTPACAFSHGLRT